MKISGWHKDNGDAVTLITEWQNQYDYDVIYISKVFTDTNIQDGILELPQVKYGGTGFFYDKAPKLPDEIEHHMPDYHLYDNWIKEKGNEKTREYIYYTDYSIGFLTRGCFRKCKFCVNQNYIRAEKHSPISEFLNNDRKKICLLDDNFLSHPDWKNMLLSLQQTKKPFQFKQGLDERLLTDEKCELLFNSKYDGDYIFAFDDINDYKIIEEKLKMIRKYTNKALKFYLLCAYDRDNNWDEDFWKQDLYDLFERIKLLIKYRCIPYIMRYNRYRESPYYGTYINLAAWCNQPSMFKKKSYREYVDVVSGRRKDKYGSSYYRYYKLVENEFPDLAEKYFDMKFT